MNLSRAASRLLCLLAILAVPSTLLAGVVQLSDGAFTPREWLDTVVVVDNPAVGGTGPLTSTGSVVRPINGGVTNSPFRRSRHIVQPGDAIRTGGIYLAEVYEPKLQGPINSLTFRIHANHSPAPSTMTSPGSSGWRPILLQGNRLYWSELSTTFTGSGWTNWALNNLTAADFDSSPLPNEAPNGEQPNFSINGDVIYFGYAITNSASNSIVDEYRGIDNWQVDINSASNRLLGDFNGDGRMNAVDYVIWRNADGRTTAGPFLGADASGDGRANMVDYNLWAMNYGRTAQIPSASGGGTLVPEPTTGWLLAMGWLAMGRRLPRLRSAAVAR